MFTDGKATSDVHIQNDADDPLSNSTETLKISMALHETSCDIGRRDIRVYCYAIGCENDIHLKTITENTEGKIYRGDDINKLIRMTQTANIALGVKDNIPDLQNLDDSAMREVCQALHVGLLDSNRDMDEVIHLIKFYRNRTKGTNQDDSRYLEMNDPVLPPLGTRVRRGPNWSWGYQDSDGPGTIVGHSPGHLWVEWDSGHMNVYKCNPIFGFDVMTVNEPRILRGDELIAVGCLVQRGADWRFDDQDGGDGNVGVVIRVDKNATVVVRWPNKQKVVYKYGNDGFFEIKLCFLCEISTGHPSVSDTVSSIVDLNTWRSIAEKERKRVHLRSPPMYSKMIMFTDGNATSDTTIQSDTDFPPSDHIETLIEEVIHLIRFFRNKMKSFVTPDEKHYNEATDSSLPPVGTRVRRGPDWSWGYQDTGGPGTVVGNSSPGQVWVEWDSGHLNIYKYHRMLGYDVTVVQEPRILGYDELIAVGCLVQRGANWKFGDQDGGKGNVGVVIKVEQNATVMISVQCLKHLQTPFLFIKVRWPNKKKAVYKYGNDGLFEIEIWYA
ncbi:hypothetical protein FSP39_003900 [Pinctada imbricata]|uniref:MIB/HERC2 domain-containing protein n=1 Tax=Pinctada imbricata TaxID=66713 RepID=A0AA88Y1Z2_PINIB|nr:hypothetical protein FSP39_003900 [Pinctada imbricata]